jgi:hypothetical protein
MTPPNVRGSGTVRANDQWVALLMETSIAVYSLVDSAGAQVVPQGGSFDGGQLALTSSDIFFTKHELDGGTTVQRSAALSGKATEIAAGPAPIIALVADDHGTFWTNADGFVHGCTDPLCASGEHRYANVANISALALDNDWVYVASPTAIERFPR